MEFSPEQNSKLKDRIAGIYLDLILADYPAGARPLAERDAFFDRVFQEIPVATQKEAFLLGALAEGVFLIASAESFDFGTPDDLTDAEYEEEF